MKTSRLIAIAILLFGIAFAKAESNTTSNMGPTTVLNWTGTYETNFGQIILLQRGDYVVGTYSDRGTIRSIRKSGRKLNVVFDNNGTLGYAYLEKTVLGFKGTWKWSTGVVQGDWNGKKVSDAQQNYHKGKWKTKFGTLDFIDSKSGFMVAHYGDKGGMIWGKKNPSTRIFKGQFKNKESGKIRPCSFIFSNSSFKGKYDNLEYGSWNGNRTQLPNSDVRTGTNLGKEYKIKITLNGFKCWNSDNLRKRERGFLGFRNQLKMGSNLQDYEKRENTGKDSWILKSINWRQWYSSNDINNYPEGQLFNTSGYFVYNVYEKQLPKISMANEFVFIESLRALKRSDFRSKRNIDMKAVIDLLTGKTSESNYARGSNGRFRIPDSPDHFKIEVKNGKRILNVYGDIKEPKKKKIHFGYYYTIELI